MKEQENLAQGYDPRGVETRWYRFWEENGFFQAEAKPGRRPYTIVIPPPNITGSLHIGHALNNTLQDILVRYKRMDGYEALWMPGTDHAGIATQNVVERELAREGKDRLSMKREDFIARVWKWREESGRTILQQLKRLGSSCDWRRERFTLDAGLSRAVREVFVRLYEEGLIYRGDYVINWCPRCLTALSDLEVEPRETPGKLYYLKYPLKKGGTITVATTRPETMLGDTAVAVNPGDERFAKLVGEKLILPLAGREIPIIAEGLVDREFGTGAVKITPAHDFNDFEIARRHQLPSITVIQPDARMSEEAGAAYRGLDRFQAREKVLADLRAQGLLEKEENYPIRLGHCYRCTTVTEPRLSRQWFVRIQPLADAAIQAVREGKTRIIPETWENNYFGWMENIRDWCISRQLWWGHQIPAWYCGECGKITVAREDPKACAHCRSLKLRQDEDVLDTWFSSALWPFSTLGWPEQTPELKFFYPTSVLVTSFDILFFWVARMMMMGIKFGGEVPFRDVYIHALVRDESGQKMSKSRGNIIDPLLIIDEYGADAFRFTLAALAAQGRDIRISEQKIEGYRHFANKIWNAFRFSLPRLAPGPGFSAPRLVLANRWIVSRLHHRIGEVRETLDGYRFNEAASVIYQFFWHELCDWYLEAIKPVFSEGSEAEIAETRSTLAYVLAESLKLLHPFMPFITEELWQKLPGREGSIMVSAFPRSDPDLFCPEAEEKLELVTEVVRAARNLRSERKIAPSDRILVSLFPEAGSSRKILEENLKLVSVLAHAREVKILSRASDLGGAPAVARDVLVEIGVGGASSLKEEERLKQELAKLRETIHPLEVKLANPDFRAKASPEAVAKAQGRYEEMLVKIRKTEEGLKLLEAKG